MVWYCLQRQIEGNSVEHKDQAGNTEITSALLRIKFSSTKNQESTRLKKIGGVHLHRREQRHQRSRGLSPGNPHALFIIINHFSHHHQFRYLALKTGETLVEDVLSFEFGRRIFIVTIIQPFVTDIHPDSRQRYTHHPPWCGEVIAHALGVLEELLGHLSTNGVTPAVPCICPE